MVSITQAQRLLREHIIDKDLKRDHEVDLVAKVGGDVIPVEVNYRAQFVGAHELSCAIELCKAKRIPAPLHRPQVAG